MPYPEGLDSRVFGEEEYYCCGRIAYTYDNVMCVGGGGGAPQHCIVIVTRVRTRGWYSAVLYLEETEEALRSKRLKEVLPGLAKASTRADKTRVCIVLSVYIPLKTKSNACL